MIVHTWKSSPLQSNLLQLQCTCCTVPTTSERPHGSPLVWPCQWPSSQPLSSPQLSYNDSLWALLNKQDTGSKVWTIERVSNCLDAHLGQIVFDKNGVMDWCIDLVEMPLTRFEECWPLPTEPQHSNANPIPLANQLWCIDFLTPPTHLIIPHRLPVSLESLMPLTNWYSIHSRGSKSSLNNSIRFCGIFPSLKQNVIAYRSSKVSSHPDCILEIRQLWQSGFSWVYFNYCYSCSFEPEIIKIGQSSHKMCCNNIVNFQVSKTI